MIDARLKAELIDYLENGVKPATYWLRLVLQDELYETVATGTPARLAQLPDIFKLLNERDPEGHKWGGWQTYESWLSTGGGR